MTKSQQIKRVAAGNAVHRCAIVLQKPEPLNELNERRVELLKRLNDATTGPGNRVYEYNWAELKLIHELLNP